MLGSVTQTPRKICSINRPVPSASFGGCSLCLKRYSFGLFLYVSGLYQAPNLRMLPHSNRVKLKFNKFCALPLMQNINYTAQLRPIIHKGNKICLAYILRALNAVWQDLFRSTSEIASTLPCIIVINQGLSINLSALDHWDINNQFMLPQ